MPKGSDAGLIETTCLAIGGSGRVTTLPGGSASSSPSAEVPNVATSATTTSRATMPCATRRGCVPPRLKSLGLPARLRLPPRPVRGAALVGCRRRLRLARAHDAEVLEHLAFDGRR